MSTLQLSIRTPDGAAAGTVSLPGEVFSAPVNVPLIHQVVVAQRAAARSGTHSTKTRGEVRGGGRKPYRQKGTGRARQGSTRAPQFAGGGVVHGPSPRSYAQRTPKKMKAAALRGALSDRAAHGRILVASALVDSDVPSTKAAIAALNEITEHQKVLVVARRGDEVTWKSLRNVVDVHLLDPGQLNTYDVLVNDVVVFLQDALEQFLGAPVEAAPVEAAPSEAAEAAPSEAAEATEAPETPEAAGSAPAAKTAEATEADETAKAAEAAEVADAAQPAAAEQTGDVEEEK